MSQSHRPSPDSPAAGHHHHDAQEMADMVTREFWDDRYGSAHAIWSGNPNPRLVEHVSHLTPGAALDIGSGEGADAIWLAARGWQVTGMDISTVALARGAQRATEAGTEIADRIKWQQVDLLSWRDEDSPAAGTAAFDLVSAQFMHLPGPVMKSVHRRLAAAVRPGGTLLIVGHHPSDRETSMGRPNLPDMFYTAEEIADSLDPASWDIRMAGSPDRQTLDPAGQPVTIRDAVLVAVRRR